MTETPRSLFSAALAAHRAGDAAAAEAGYRAVLAQLPDLLPALDNLTLLLAAQRRLADLVEVHQQALAVDDTGERRYVLAIAQLYLGRYAEAWPNFEHRPTKAAGAPRTAVPEWTGEPLAGRSIVVWHEQGLGDQIQMARFIPRLGAERVYFACLPPLARLMGQLCTPLPRLGEIRGRFDFWVSSMSLPGRLGATLATLPPPAPFRGEARRRGGLGVCWRAGETSNPGRSLPAELAGELLAIPGAMSLHPEDTGAADFQDTADVIAGLEAVVTVDTAVTHLAASLGKPTFLLLPHEGDWRWLLGRTDSPWYPTVRIFRQPTTGDWRGALDALLRQLG